jgi:cation diffusion facilitator CzcD-associated flavoprotein CzcO
MNHATSSKKRIVIIGAGSAGLVALKTLREAKPFQRGEWEIIVFEQREALGGIW